MLSYENILQELQTLESDLKETTNLWWKLKLSLLHVLSPDPEVQDFMPERLIRRKKEVERKLKGLLFQLEDFVESRLGSSLFVFQSAEDVQNLLTIRKTIRYLRNAYSRAWPLTQTLDKLNKALPFASNN